MKYFARRRATDSRRYPPSPRCLTLPSRGRFPAFGLQAPLMSNVGRIGFRPLAFPFEMKISLSRLHSVLVINLKGGASRPPISPIDCQKPTPGLHEPPGRKAPLCLIGQGVLSFRRSREAALSGKPATLDGAHTARNPQRMGFCAPVSRAYRRLPCVAVPHAPNPRSVEAPPLPPAAWLAPHGRRLTLTLDLFTL